MKLLQIARGLFGSSQQQPQEPDIITEQEWIHAESLIRSGNTLRAAHIAIFHRTNADFFYDFLNAERDVKLSLLEELNLMTTKEASSFVVRFFRSDKYNYDEDGQVIKRRNIVDYLIYHGTEQNAAERFMSMIETQADAQARAFMIGADKGEVYRAFVDKGYGARADAVINELDRDGREYVMSRIANGRSQAPTADMR